MATEAIKPTLHSPVRGDGKRHPIHFRTEGGQVPLTGLRAFPGLGLSEEDTTNTAVEKIAQAVEESRSRFCISIVIPADGWEAIGTAGEYGYYRDIFDGNISGNKAPGLVFPVEEAAYASSCGISDACETMAGRVRVYAIAVPEREIPATLYLVDATTGTYGIPVTIPASGWTADASAGDYTYHLDLANSSITADMAPSLAFSVADIGAANSCGIGGTCEALDGKLRVYAMEIPAAPIPAMLCILSPSSGGGTSPAEIPVASATRAGIVKIGKNIDVTRDGTISIPVSLNDTNGNGIPDAIDQAISEIDPVGPGADETVSEDEIDSIFVD